MRQSVLFTKTRREAPKDEVAKNAQLLIRAGYVHKEMAGVYDFLPLGLRVLTKISTIIREEMNAIGGQEILMSSLQRRELWEKTERWDDRSVDSWFKTSLRHEADSDGGRSKEVGLAFTHEEPMTNMMEQFILSHRDLPKYLYQFQTKFRNEKRAKSGIMRTREFVMKDLYSFSKNSIQHLEFYQKAADAYRRIFDRCGLGHLTYMTFASGGSFSKYSHEFQALCESGEDTIYIDEKTKQAVNEEVYDDTEVYEVTGLNKQDLKKATAVEVGNIFSLGTRFSEALGLTFKRDDGSEEYVYMGSYGIGPARLMGVIVEVLSDEKGIVWPEEVAPFAVHLICLSGGNADVSGEADRLYELLRENGVEVLYDDRQARAGEKFADAELIGVPRRLVVSEKTMSEGGAELTERGSGATMLLPENAIIERFK